MIRRKALLIGIVFLLLVACSKDKEQAHENEGKENAFEEKELNEEQNNTYPLTGIATNEDVDQRIVSVMVNNHRKARPQSGLSKADIVFEILAEGDITRFLALYQSEQPEVVGPVRSAREYYFTLADNYDALYVYHGAANFVNDMIVERGIDHLNGSVYDNDGHLFKRESFRKAPHNSYLQYSAVHDVATEKGYSVTSSDDLSIPFLDEDESIMGEDGYHVEISYIGQNPSHLVEYVYNEDSGKYMRYEDHEQTVELNTGESIEVDNVFIIEATHEVIDKEGRRKVDLNSGGTAYLLQKGKFQEVEWTSVEGQIIPTNSEQTIGFVPGKTWVNVVPTQPGIQETVHIHSD